MGDSGGEVNDFGTGPDGSASELTRRRVRAAERSDSTAPNGDEGNGDPAPTREEPKSSADPPSGRQGRQRASDRRQRQKFDGRRPAGVGLKWLLLGALLSLAVSCFLGWRLLLPLQLELDPAEIAAVLSDSLVAQSGAINALVRHLRHAQRTEARRVDFLALGPVGTGKTLLTQVLATRPLSVTARRLVGDVEITHNRAALDRLAAELAAAPPAGGWLLLALDDVKNHLPQAVYLLEAVDAALAGRGVRLITLVTATSSDLAGERGAEATREAFARHSHVLPFRPLRPSAVVACLQRYAGARGVALTEETARTLVKAVKFDGQYAVNGCKPAIYHLQTALKLEPGASERQARGS